MFLSQVVPDFLGLSPRNRGKNFKQGIGTIPLTVF